MHLLKLKASGESSDMIDPKSINLSSLPSLPLSQHSKLPAVPGIYFAVDSFDVIQYIGRSVNLKQRWLAHHRKKQLEQMGSVQLIWLEVGEPSLLPEIEDALIAWFNPPLNSVWKPLELNPGSSKPPSKPAYVDLSPFWKDASPTISDAIEKTGLDRRTLSAAKKGHLDRCQVETLFKLRDFASELADRKLSLEDICKERS